MRRDLATRRADGRPVHAIGRALEDPSPAGRCFRLVAVVVGVGLAVALLRNALLTTLSPATYYRDFAQDYLFARAVRDGHDPYLPIQALAERYLPVPVLNPHPTPHPPPAGLLFLPLASLDYHAASLVWLGAQLACLFASAHLLLRAVGARPSPLATGGVGAAMLAWPAFHEDLANGQLMVVLLLPLVGAWLALRRGRRGLGGALLGVATLLKPVAWPALLLFALRREWRVVAVSLATVALGYAAAGAALGVDRLRTYLVVVLPTVGDFYRAYSGNVSLWTLGWRLFHGTESLNTNHGVAAPPLVVAPEIAPLVAALVPAVLVLAACLAARRRDLDPSLGVMLCVGVLVSPVSWGYYPVLAAVPVAQIVRWLVERRFPAKETNLAVLVGLMLLLPPRGWTKIALLMAGQPATLEAPPALPFAAALLTLGPALAVGSLGLLLLSVSERRSTAW